MSGEWRSKPLAELVDPGRGISYGIVQPGHAVAYGVPIVRVSDVRNGKIDTSSPLKVDPQVEHAYRRTRLRGGELLITIVGTVGETAIAPVNLAGWNVARAIAVLPILPEIGAYWVKLALRSPEAQSLIQSRLNTTVQATLNLGDLAQLPILVPPLGERERITAILGSLDAKIDLNGRMNETLEAMTRAIFQDWFVTFGPTRAKQEGRPPYLAPDLWSLFPDRLDDDGTPMGWRSRKLTEIAPLASGSTWSIDLRDDNGSAVAFGANGPIGRSSRWNGEGRAIFLGKIGSCGAFNEYNGRFWATNNVYYVTEKQTEFLEISRCLLRSIDWSVFVGGSSNPYMPIKNFEHLTIRFPDIDLARAFEQIAGGWREVIEHNLRQTSTLTATRDLLLPKLMSGELRIRDAERDVEAVL